MTQTLKVGLIGLGEVAQLMHLPLLADDQRFSVAAITDVSPSLVEHIARRYGVPTRHDNAAALIADPGLDAVFILTPDHLHADLLAEVSRRQPDVILIEVDAPTRDTLESLSQVHRNLPRPIVLFSNSGEPATIRQAVQAGVTSYVVDGMSPARLKPIMDVAENGAPNSQCPIMMPMKVSGTGVSTTSGSLNEWNCATTRM